MAVSNLISSAELASLQSFFGGVLDKPCVLRRRTRTGDGMGSYTETWQVISPPNFMAMMAQPSGNELANFDFLIGDKVAWTLRFLVGTVVAPQDQAVIEGQTLEIHALLTPQSYPMLLSVIAAEIQ